MFKSHATSAPTLAKLAERIATAAKQVNARGLVRSKLSRAEKMRLDLQLCGRVLRCLHCEVWVTLVDARNLRAHRVDSSDGIAESASFCRVGATKNEVDGLLE
jgi:hypothetical protein